MKKTALITGASSGIGRELAGLFARDGYNLVITARDEMRLNGLAKTFRTSFGTRTKIIARDLSLPSSPREIYEETNRDGIAVDVLVNNAGFNVYGPFFEADLEKTLAMIQVNLVAITHLTRLILPAMVERGAGQVLNIGSTGSFAPAPLNAVYCATKAYVLSFTEAIAEELKGTGVSAMALCPGATETEFAHRAGMADIRLFRTAVMDVRQVAEAGYRSLRKGRPIITVPGILNRITVASLRFTPRAVVGRLGVYLMSRAAQ